MTDIEHHIRINEKLGEIVQIVGTKHPQQQSFGFNSSHEVGDELGPGQSFLVALSSTSDDECDHTAAAQQCDMGNSR